MESSRLRPGSQRELTRRSVLGAGGLTVVAVALGACSPTQTDEEGTAGDAQVSADASGGAGPDPVPAADTGPSVLTVADFAALATCMPLRASAAGPFPLDEQFDRRDVTEGYPGHPVRLGFRVIDPECASVSGAVVEIWHTDATGDYSAFEDGGTGKDEAGGTTFLRGSQVADDDGIVEFHTIYPGWYPGRAVHIHLRVHVGDDVAVTSQVYFDETYTETVYAEAAYADQGLQDTTHATDGLAGEPSADGTLLTLSVTDTDQGPGTLALLNLGVRSAGATRQ
jgi:protocatechuate 3,4-dioxygenase beta subunit